MQKYKHKYKMVINPISKPAILTLYKDNRLFKSFKLDGFVSDGLCHKFNEINKKYPISEVIYVNGPGSYMGIKLTFIMLKSLNILKGTPFYGCLGFELNNNKPIKAMGKLYFVKEKEIIITKKFDEPISQEFIEPEDWNSIKKSLINEPIYNIPAV